MVFVPWGERPGSLFHAAQHIKRAMQSAPKDSVVSSDTASDEANLQLAAGVPRPDGAAGPPPLDPRKAARGLMDLLIGKKLEYVGAKAAESESVASQLPGRERGPADAYRHILWAAELTRRFGQQRAREILDLHEREGELRGQPAEKAMDLANNEIGVKIGIGARTFDDVISAARKAISGSHPGGNGAWKPGYDTASTLAPHAASWLREARWANNPAFDKRIPAQAGERPRQGRMPNSMTNWYANPNRANGPDWVAGYLPEPSRYPFGGAQHATGPDDAEMLRASAGYREYVDGLASHPELAPYIGRC